MKLYRIETARVTVSPGDIREMARLYRLDDGDTETLVALARQAKRPGWWKGMAQALPAGFSVHLELETTRPCRPYLRGAVRSRAVANRRLRPRGAARPQRQQHP